MIRRSQILNKAVDESKIKDTAVRKIRLASGGVFQLEDSDGSPLLIVENDTKKLKIRGNWGKI